MGKLLRRLIIGIALFLLIPNILMLFTVFDRDIPKEISKQVEAGNAKMIKLNEEVTLDQDIIKFKHLILSKDETLLIYEVHANEQGWSFPGTFIKLMDKQGNSYKSDGGSSSGKSWGEFSINQYEPLPKGIDAIVLDFNWYDRAFQTEISLKQEEL